MKPVGGIKMGNYPDFFYDDLPYDPCDGCSDCVDGLCLSDGGCCPILSQDEFEEILQMLVVVLKVRFLLGIFPG